MKISHLIALLLCVLCLSSCHTIFNGYKTDVVFDGAADASLRIITKNDTVKAPVLPATVRVARRDLNKPIRFESDSFRYADIIPGKQFDSNALISFEYIIGDFILGTPYKARKETYPLQRYSMDSTQPLEVADYRKQPIEIDYDAPRHEIGLNIGFGATAGRRALKRIDEHYQGMLEEDEPFGCGGPVDQIGVGGFYFYHFNAHWAAGVLGGWVKGNSSSFFIPTEDVDKTGYRLVNSVRSRVLYLLPSVKYSWLVRRHLQLYSKVGAGIYRQRLKTHYDFYPEVMYCNRTRVRAAYQVSPLGICVGGKYVHFFAEGGYGDEGVVNMGLSFRFGKHK